MSTSDDDLLRWLSTHDFVIDETELDDPWPDLEVRASTLSSQQLGYLESFAGPLEAEEIDAAAELDPGELDD